MLNFFQQTAKNPGLFYVFTLKISSRAQNTLNIRPSAHFVRFITRCIAHFVRFITVHMGWCVMLDRMLTHFVHFVHYIRSIFD